MVKDHSDSERGNPLPPHGQLVGTRNSSMGPPLRIDLMSYHTTELHFASKIKRKTKGDIKKGK